MDEFRYMIVVLKVAFELYSWPPEQGRWDMVLSQNDDIFTFSKYMSNDTKISLIANCEDALKTVDISWILRKVDCYNEGPQSKQEPQLIDDHHGFPSNGKTSSLPSHYHNSNVCNKAIKSMAFANTWDEGIYELKLRVVTRGNSTDTLKKYVTMNVLNTKGYLSPRDQPMMWIDGLSVYSLSILALILIAVLWPKLIQKRLRVVLAMTVCAGAARSWFSFHMYSSLNMEGKLDLYYALANRCMKWLFDGSLMFMTFLFTSGYGVVRYEIPRLELIFYTVLVLASIVPAAVVHLLALKMDITTMANLPGIVHLADLYTPLGVFTVFVLALSCARSIAVVWRNPNKYECHLKQGLAVLIAANLASIFCIIVYFSTPTFEIDATCEENNSLVFVDTAWKEFANMTLLSILSLMWFCDIGITIPDDCNAKMKPGSNKTLAVGLLPYDYEPANVGETIKIPLPSNPASPEK